MSDSRVQFLICWNVFIVISTALFIYAGRAILLIIWGSFNIIYYLGIGQCYFYLGIG